MIHIKIGYKIIKTFYCCQLQKSLRCLIYFVMSVKQTKLQSFLSPKHDSLTVTAVSVNQGKNWSLWIKVLYKCNQQAAAQLQFVQQQMMVSTLTFDLCVGFIFFLLS